MDAKEIEKRYLWINKVAGRLVGAWPYATKRSKRLRQIFALLIILSLLVTQIARVVVFYSFDVLIEQLNFICLAIIFISKEGNHILNEEKLKVLLNGIFRDWRRGKSKEEYDIMREYAKKGLFVIRVYLVITYLFAFLVFVNGSLGRNIIDYFVAENFSQRTFPFPVYYFTEEEKYYCLKFIHITTVAHVAAVIFVAFDTTYMYIVHHACGLIAVSGHHFKYAIDESFYRNHEDADKMARKMYEKVCYSIQAQKHALNYIAKIQSAYEISLSVCEGCLTLMISTAFVKISSMNLDEEFYKFGAFTVGQLGQLFFINIQGQFIIDSFDECYYKIYEGLWYNSPPKVQKLYLLALRRGLTYPVLRVPGFMILNLETFIKILKVAISYFTVLRST